MTLMRKAVPIAYLASMLLSLVCLVMLVFFNFAGVFTIKTIPGTKYETAFTYPGWQSIFWGVGEMIIQGYNEFTFDIWTCLGLFVPFICLIVCSILYLKAYKAKGKNRFKSILEFVMAGTLVFGGIMLFNCDLLSIANASKVTGSYQNYYTQYLLPALNGEEYFKKEAYPKILLIVCLITAAFKTGNGLLLIYQKRCGKLIKERNLL